MTPPPSPLRRRGRLNYYVVPEDRDFTPNCAMLIRGYQNHTPYGVIGTFNFKNKGTNFPKIICEFFTSLSTDDVKTCCCVVLSCFCTFADEELG